MNYEVMRILYEVLRKLLLHSQSHPKSLQLIESITILRSVTFNKEFSDILRLILSNLTYFGRGMINNTTQITIK